MNYRLSVANETHPIQDIQFPMTARLADGPVGKPLSFISPVRLRSGQQCVLRGDAGGYQFQVNACLGFTFTPRFLVSGMIKAIRD